LNDPYRFSKIFFAPDSHEEGMNGYLDLCNTVCIDEQPMAIRQSNVAGAENWNGRPFIKLGLSEDCLS
jgi:hypothetical protein